MSSLKAHAFLLDFFLWMRGCAFLVLAAMLLSLTMRGTGSAEETDFWKFQYENALYKYLTGNFIGAYQDFNKLLQTEKENKAKIALRFSILSLAAMNQGKEVLQKLKIYRKSTQPETLFDAAEKFYEWGEYRVSDEILRILQRKRLTVKQSDRLNFLYGKTLVHLEEGRGHPVEYLNKVAEKSEFYIQAQSLKARLLFRDREFEAAEYILEALLVRIDKGVAAESGDETDTESLELLLGEMYFENEKFDKAEELFTGAKEGAGLAYSSLNGIYRVYFRSGRFTDALETLSRLKKDYRERFIRDGLLVDIAFSAYYAKEYSQAALFFKELNRWMDSRKSAMESILSESDAKPAIAISVVKAFFRNRGSPPLQDEEGGSFKDNRELVDSYENSQTLAGLAESGKGVAGKGRKLQMTYRMEFGPLDSFVKNFDKRVERLDSLYQRLKKEVGALNFRVGGTVHNKNYFKEWFESNLSQFSQGKMHKLTDFEKKIVQMFTHEIMYRQKIDTDFITKIVANKKSLENLHSMASTVWPKKIDKIISDYELGLKELDQIDILLNRVKEMNGEISMLAEELIKQSVASVRKEAFRILVRQKSMEEEVKRAYAKTREALMRPSVESNAAEAAYSEGELMVKTDYRESESAEIKKKLQKKEREMRAITKYLSGNISFLDNYSSSTLLEFAEILYDYADLKHTLDVISFSREDGAPDAPPKADFGIPIGFLDEIIEKRGFDESIDKFFYLRAICYEEQGLPEKSAEDYKRVVERYRLSSLYPEAVFRLGEYYFSTGQIAMAIDTYSLNGENTGSKFYDKTLYKLGWSYYRAHDYLKAIKYFMEVAAAGFQKKKEQGKPESGQGAGKESGRVNLVDEALTYVALSYVNFGSPDEIETFFRLEGKPYSEQLLDKIGDAFSEQAKFDEAVTVFRKMISMFPFSPGIPAVHGKIVSIFEKTVAVKADVFAEKREFIVSYSPGSVWFGQNSENPASTRLLDTVEPMILDTAAYFLKRAGAGDTALYGEAEKLYRRYLAIYGKSRRANRVNFLLGEALFGLRKYSEAVAEYKKSAWEYPDTAFQEKSAYAVILAYEEILKAEGGTDSVNGETISNEMILAIKRFLGKFPSAASSGEVRLKEGEIYFNLGKYDDAITLFSKIRQDLGSVDEKIVAAGFLADSYFNKKNYRRAEAEYGELSRLAGLVSNYRLQRKAEHQRVVSILNMGQSLKKRGDLEAAAEMFERANALSNSVEESKFALGEAIKIYIETLRWSKFDSALINFRNRYSENRRVSRFLVAAGKACENNFQFTRAARYFEGASGIINEKNQVRDYLLLAANNYQKSGDIQKAVTIFSRLSEIPSLEGKKSIEYLFRAGELMEKQGESEGALNIFRKVVSKHRRLTAGGESGNAYYFGKARFILMDAELSGYMKMRLKQPFKESFRAKADLMRKLLREYIEISRLDVREFTSRSLFTIGRIFENFRDDILNSDIPENLKGEEREEYSFMLEEKAFPYEQNAEKTYKKNIGLARKKSVTNSYVDSSYRRLALLSPALFKRDETLFPLKIFVPEPSFMEELAVDKKNDTADAKAPHSVMDKESAGQDGK